MSSELDEPKAEVVLHREEGESLAPVTAQGNAVNPFLIFACVTFAAASFLFGYDDKVISPVMYVVALSPFASLSANDC